MPSSIDPAILRALSVDASSATISSHGSGGFASTFKIKTPETSLFVKTSSSADASTMFEGEHASLNAIHKAVPSLCPRSFAWGALDKGGYFLCSEFLDLNASSLSRSRGAAVSSTAKGSGMTRGMTLAQKLAKLHSVPAPTHQGYDRPVFGFPHTTCCGSTPQPNDFNVSWPDFFARSRLLFILERGEKQQGKQPELRKLVERTVDEVVPRLLGDGHLGSKKGIIPVVVHGDLWSGNQSRGSFVGREGQNPDEAGAVEDVVFDPSACYAHHEYEHGIMEMFGGFESSFWKEYESILPRTEPAKEYEDRVALYQSYHYGNHWALFGGSYKSSMISILRNLLKKYGNG